MDGRGVILHQDRAEKFDGFVRGVVRFEFDWIWAAVLTGGHFASKSSR